MPRITFRRVAVAALLLCLAALLAFPLGVLATVFLAMIAIGL